MWKPILTTTILVASGTSLAFAQSTAPAPALGPKKVLPSFEQSSREPSRLRIEQLGTGNNGSATTRLVDPAEWMHRRATAVQENGGVPKND